MDIPCNIPAWCRSDRHDDTDTMTKPRPCRICCRWAMCVIQQSLESHSAHYRPLYSLCVLPMVPYWSQKHSRKPCQKAFCLYLYELRSQVVPITSSCFSAALFSSLPPLSPPPAPPPSFEEEVTKNNWHEWKWQPSKNIDSGLPLVQL